MIYCSNELKVMYMIPCENCPLEYVQLGSDMRWMQGSAKGLQHLEQFLPFSTSRLTYIWWTRVGYVMECSVYRIFASGEAKCLPPFTSMKDLSARGPRVYLRSCSAEIMSKLLKTKRKDHNMATKCRKQPKPTCTVFVSMAHPVQ